MVGAGFSLRAEECRLHGERRLKPAATKGGKKSFMKEETYNEQELQKLEAELRAMGIPYSENEPDDRYFANFRVRVMERIEVGQALLPDKQSI